MDEWVETWAKLDVDASAIPLEQRYRLESLMGRASHGEIVWHLTRMALHRPKGSLGEYTLPAFIEDVAHDLKAKGVTSLGMAMTTQSLRLNAKNEWFPAWKEIEQVSDSVENALLSLRNSFSGAAPKQIEKRKPRPSTSYMDEMLKKHDLKVIDGGKDTPTQEETI